ncbi:hypothetical protein TRAPUB_3476, partial [Trametes pubescens]
MAFAHPLWSIAEVVREVMIQSADEHNTLAKCAIVSRALSEPALEVLWEKQQGLGKLLGLLPASFKKADSGADVQDQFGNNIESESFVLYNPIQEQQWSRLVYYAGLVRSFSGMEDAFDGLAAAVLIQKLNGRALFPRLKRLVWKRPFDGAASALLVLCLSPMLRNGVYLDVLEGGMGRFRHYSRTGPTAAEYAYGTALQLIHSHAPKVEDVQLWTSGFSCSVARLREFDNLRVLTLRQVIDVALVFDVCKSLPLLQKLDIYVARPDIEPEPEPVQPAIPEFTHAGLTCLELNAPPQVALAALEALHAPSLRSLGLLFEAYEDTWKRCTELIASRFADSLRTLDLEVEDSYHDADIGISLHDWFSPLYTLRELRSVGISSHFETRFTITANDVHAMGAAWPQLEDLRLPTVQDEPLLELPITLLEVLVT